MAFGAQKFYITPAKPRMKKGFSTTNAFQGSHPHTTEGCKKPPTVHNKFNPRGEKKCEE
jgi:hypothetical protein